MIEATDESMDIIWNIFQQGDTRYEDTPVLATVAGFLDNKAMEK